MSLIRAIRELVIQNPLVWAMLRKSTAYTWGNLISAVGVAAVLAGTLTRLWIYYDFRIRLGALPEELRPEEVAYFFAYNAHEAVYYGRPDRLETYAFGWQMLGVGGICGVAFISAVLRWRRFRSGRRELIPQDLRVTPVTVSQCVFANYRVPLLKYYGFLILAAILLLVPTRPAGVSLIISKIFWGPAIGGKIYDASLDWKTEPEWILLIGAVSIGVLLWAIDTWGLTVLAGVPFLRNPLVRVIPICMLSWSFLLVVRPRFEDLYGQSPYDSYVVIGLLNLLMAWASWEAGRLSMIRLRQTAS